MTDLDLESDKSAAASTDLTGCAGCSGLKASPVLTRRAILRGIGAVTLGAAAAGALAACSPDDTPDTADSAAGTAAAGGVLAKVSDIPVGGAISATGADGAKIILSQPAEGTIVGMSAICPHQGGTVVPDGAELKCQKHGSIFTMADGANVSGPAEEPLPVIVVTVTEGNVLAG